MSNTDNDPNRMEFEDDVVTDNTFAVRMDRQELNDPSFSPIVSFDHAKFLQTDSKHQWSGRFRQ